jgi:hypothetical protein
VDTIAAPEDFYTFLRGSGHKVLSNIIFNLSPGHQIQELDYFLRKYHVGDVRREDKYLWIQLRTDITQALAETYGLAFRDYNLGMIAHDSLFEMMMQVTRMAPELGVDVGLSHIKNSVMSRENTWVVRFAETMFYAVSNERLINTYMDYYSLRARTLDFDPWTAARPPLDGPLADLLGGGADRLAVVHFRARAGNAGLVMSPEAMAPTLGYLRDCGYTIVKVGTEPYPAEFAEFGVINYSESELRSFRNDLVLLSHAKLALINASGLENLVDCMGIPMVSYARWHLTLAPCSATAVILPSLFYDPARQRLMSFAEQILFFKTRPAFWENARFCWQVPVDRFIPRPPQPDEMLAAVQEAVALGEGPRPLSDPQTRFRRLEENGPLALVGSRVSDFFLERFQALL